MYLALVLLCVLNQVMALNSRVVCDSAHVGEGMLYECLLSYVTPACMCRQRQKRHTPADSPSELYIFLHPRHFQKAVIEVGRHRRYLPFVGMV